MPTLAELMTSGRNYPTGQEAPRTVMEPPPAEEKPPAQIDPAAFGQTLASFLAQAGLADTVDATAIAKGPTPGQFTLAWGAETLHLLSTGPTRSPQPEQLVIVPEEAYAQYGKTRSAAKRQALLDSIVAGTQGSPSTILGGV